MANVDSNRKSKGDKKAKRKYNVYKKGGRNRANPIKDKEDKK